MTYRSTSPPLPRVVVATDFSSGGRRAVTRAARIPLGVGARLTLVHVLPSAVREHGAVVANARGALDQVVSEFLEIAPPTQAATIDSVLAFGDAHEEILRIADTEPKAALIVLGRHGTRRFRDSLLGTTAERVVRHGMVPVLIVQGIPNRPYRRLLAAVELPLESGRRALDLGLHLLGPGGDESRVVHVLDDAGDRALRPAGLPASDLATDLRKRRADTAATIHSWLKSQYGGALRWRVTVHAGDPRGWILAVAKRHKPDLICLGTHARTGLSRVFLGSVAEAVARGASCDVLIARP